MWSLYFSLNNSYGSQATTAISIVNPVHAASELKDFKEAFDDGINFFNEGKAEKACKAIRH